MLLYFLVQNSGCPLQGCVFVGRGAADVVVAFRVAVPFNWVLLAVPARTVKLAELVVTVALLAVLLLDMRDVIDVVRLVGIYVNEVDMGRGEVLLLYVKPVTVGASPAGACVEVTEDCAVTVTDCNSADNKVPTTRSCILMKGGDCDQFPASTRLVALSIGIRLIKISIVELNQHLNL